MIPMDTEAIPPISEAALPARWMPIQIYTQNNLKYQVEGLARFTGCVLAYAEIGAHQLVVWNAHYHDDTWSFSGGEYFDFSQLDLAQHCFGRRVANNCWGATYRGLRSVTSG